MNRNTKRKFESDEFIPDDGSMHNMNTNLNPNRQPQGQQPHAHTSGSGVGPVAFNNNLNHFDYNSNLAATFTDSTLPSTESSSSRIFSHQTHDGAFGQRSNATSLSDDSASRNQPTISNRPQDIQPVLPHHRGPNELLHMDPGEFYSSAADEILSQAMQIPENAGLDYYTLLAEQDIPDPGICRSDATVVPHQQESHQPTQQMLVQQIARHCQALQAFCAGGNPNSEDYFPQMQIYIQRQIESLQSLGIYADVSAQGPHTSSLPRQQIYDGTAEPAEPAEHDDEKEARGEAPPNGKRYRCKDPRCSQKPQVFTLHATFGRHIETQHHPRVIYNCPVPCGCRQKFTRRDKVGAHCRAAHLTDPNTVNIDGNKVNIQCPAICALCPRVVRSWSAFYKCFMSHCVIEDEPVDNHQQTPHHDGSGNGGAGSAHGNESNASASKTGGARGTMSNEGFGGNAGHSQGRGFQSRQYNGNQMDPNQPTALDNPSFPGEADFLASPQPYPTSSIPEQRRGSTDQVPPGTLPRGQTFRPPPRQQPPPTETLLYEQLRCQRCPHFFSSCDPNCTLLTRTDGCHACDAGIALTTDMASIARGLGSHRQPYLPGRRAQTLRNSGLQMTGRGTPEHGVRQIRQLRHQIQDYRSGGSQRTGGSTGAMFVTEITEPDFSEHELLKPSGLNATKAESTALWLPIRSLPKSVAKILQPESSELDEDAPVQVNLPDLPPSVLARPAPPFVCHCPCVVKAKGTSYSHQAQLTSGKFLDVNMNFFSEERSGHPLRTRIRVVVKLFKLRSSVTRSYDKRKSTEDGKTIENAFKASLNEQTLVLWSQQNGYSHEERNDPDDSDASDLDESIFSDTASQTSSASEVLSASEISERTVELYKAHASPEDFDFLFHDADGVNSHLNDDCSFEHAPDQHADQDGVLISSESETNALIPNEDRTVEVRDTTAFHKDIEQEFEFSMDLPAETYMRGLAALTNGLADVDVEDLSQDNINDPEQVFKYSFRFILYVIFALSHSKNYPSPSLLN